MAGKSVGRQTGSAYQRVGHHRIRPSDHLRGLDSKQLSHVAVDYVVGVAAVAAASLDNRQ